MTVEEVFATISAHMIEGMMTHEALANYYDFLGLKGYKRCQEYHYLDETISHRSINRYFINHHGKLIPEKKVDDPEIIPDSWYDHVREDVDTSTKRKAIKDAYSKWQNWEIETLSLYKDLCKELCDLGEFADVKKVEDLICDVSCELKFLERDILNLEAVDYDIIYIIEQQECIHEKYKKKMKKGLNISIC
jgi:hypothetical protein